MPGGVTWTAFPTNFEATFEALQPGWGLGPQADADIRDLARRGFAAATGVHIPQLGHLANIAGQIRVLEYANDTGWLNGEVKQAKAGLYQGRPMVGIYEVDGLSGQLGVLELRRLAAEGVRQVAYAYAAPQRTALASEVSVAVYHRVGARGRLLARERRRRGESFRLGPPLARLLNAALVQQGVSRSQLWVETWESNPGNHLYDELGYAQLESVAPLPDMRPTLHLEGDVVDGHTVTYDKRRYTMVVPDRRLIMTLGKTAV